MNEERDEYQEWEDRELLEEHTANPERFQKLKPLATMESTTETLVGAMRVLAREIESPDGLANAAIAEAADRLEWQAGMIGKLKGHLTRALEEIACRAGGQSDQKDSETQTETK